MGQVFGAAGLGADTRQLESAKGLAVDQGAGDSAVDVEIAHPELAAGPPDGGGAAGVEAAGQREPGAVGQTERLVEGVVWLNHQHRTENLLLGDLCIRVHPGENMRRDIASSLNAFRWHSAGVCDLGPVFDRPLDHGEDTVAGFGIDDRRDRAAWVFGGADQAAARNFHQAIDKRLDHVPGNQHAAAGGAFLAGVPEGAFSHPADGLIQVGVGIHQDGVLATHFRQHPFDMILATGGFSGLAVDRQADLHAAGEGYHRHLRMADQNRAHLLADPRQVMQHIRRDAGLMQDLDEPPGRHRCLFGRFEHHGTSGRQSGDGHAAGDGQREIPRRDDGGHTPRLVEHQILLTRDIPVPGSQPCLRLQGVVAAKIDRLGDIGIGLPPGLAGLQANPCRQFGPTVTHDPCGPAEDVGAFLDRTGGPCRQSLGSLGDGAQGLGLRRACRVADDLGMVCRVGTGDLAGGSHPLAADQKRIALAQPGPRAFQGNGHGLAGGIQGKIGQGLRFQRGIQGLLYRSTNRFGGDFGGGGVIGWIHEQHLLRYLLGHAGPKERIVGGILEQATHQIGHTGQQFAIGHVHPHPLAQGSDRVHQCVAHAVEHLDLEGPPGQFHLFGKGHRLRQAAQIVAGEGGAQVLAVGEEKFRLALVGDIALPFSLPHGSGPAVLRANDRLRVPVGTLDQPDSHRCPAPLGPGGQHSQVIRCGAEVCLNGDAHMGPVAEFRFHQEAGENGQGEVLEAALLHVEMDKGALPDRLAQDGTHAVHDPVRRPVEIQSVRLTVKR